MKPSNEQDPLGMSEGMDEKELLPCPFCGEAMERAGGMILHKVFNPDCFVCEPLDCNWNRRTEKVPTTGRNREICPRCGTNSDYQTACCRALDALEAKKDGEIARLHEHLKAAGETWNAMVDDRAKLTAEIERLKVDLALRGEGYDPAKTASLGQKLAFLISDRERLKEELASEREAAKGLMATLENVVEPNHCCEDCPCADRENEILKAVTAYRERSEYKSRQRAEGESEKKDFQYGVKFDQKAQVIPLPEKKTDWGAKRTADEWMALLHPACAVMDPDGWRGEGRPDWEAAISLDEFSKAFCASTVRCSHLEAPAQKERSDND